MNMKDYILVLDITRMSRNGSTFIKGYFKGVDCEYNTHQIAKLIGYKLSKNGEIVISEYGTNPYFLIQNAICKKLDIDFNAVKFIAL